MPFANVIELSDLTAATGVQINGRVAGSGLGSAVSRLGDLNGDGFDDFLVGANTEGSYAGAAYVVFGGPSLGAGFSVAGLDGSNGFRLSGAGGDLGYEVSSGDVNGDGVIDLIVGADNFRTTYVVFGHTGPWAASLDVTTLDGATGFSATGGPKAGSALASGGDINGDGIEDLVIGAFAAGFGGPYSGSVYVVFGKTGGHAATSSLASLTGTDGFRLDGIVSGDLSGQVVGLADINHDGLSDILIGAQGAAGGAGAGYVVFGKAGGWSATQSLATLDGSNGFKMSTGVALDRVGAAISSAGDLNGDGIEDLAVGSSQTSRIFIVFGREGAWDANLNLGALDGVTGTVLTGTGGLGAEINPAGDVNNDGFDDLIIGAPTTSAHGSSTGSAVILFGRQSWTASQTVAGLNGASTGFVLVGEASGDQAGRAVSGAGDINGDGIDDLLVAASGQDVGGAFSGAAYVIYGVQGNLTRIGTAADETLTGASADDTLSGMAGRDVLNGLFGDDVLNGGDNGDTLYGSDGNDILNGDAGGDVLYGDAGADTLNGGADGDKLNGGAGGDTLNGGDGADRLFGDDGIDTLNGGDGNDYLDGGVGRDTMSGGAGNDVYIIGVFNDVTIEAAGEGYDIVRSALTWSLDDNFEAIELQGSGDVDANGNSEANNLQGNSGNNTLRGEAGNDTLNGNDGNDRIVGGQGNDLLRGGLGADRFEVDHAFGPVLETDQIYDFSDAEGDWFDLSGAYAGTIVEVAAFSKQPGQMTLTFAAGITTLRLDINGDGRPDYQARINGDVTDHATAWLL